VAQKLKKERYGNSVKFSEASMYLNALIVYLPLKGSLPVKV